VYTAQFRSMYAERTAERVGLNFSQPGVMHPQGSGNDAIDTMTWEQVKAKFGKTTTTEDFCCTRCNRKFPCHGKRRFRPHGDGGGRVCAGCYQSLVRAASLAFKCAVCDNDVSPGKRSRPHGDGGGRVCDACYQSAWLAKQPAFTCRKCGTEVAPGKESHPHGEGGGRVCAGCYQSALKAKQLAFTCRECGTGVSPGNRSYSHGDGGGRVCVGCYRKRPTKMTQVSST